MKTPLKPPYIKKVGQRGKIVIWVVDGTYVRTHLDEEFTNYGQHYAFKFIPVNEIWIDREGKPDEVPFFIDHLLVEHRLMTKGVPYDDALEAADKAERRERKGFQFSVASDVLLVMIGAYVACGRMCYPYL